MAVGLKIIVAAVNLVCLIITLIYPNGATPISLLPCWVTAGMWLYNRLSSFSGKKIKAIAITIPLAFLTFCAAFSFFVGFACDYKSPEVKEVSEIAATPDQEVYDYPYYEAKSDAMIPFDLHIDFRVFQIFVFVTCFVYYVAEIVFEFSNKFGNAQKPLKEKSTQTPNQLVNAISK